MLTALFVAFLATCFIVGVITVVSFTIQAIGRALFGKLKETPNGDTTHVLPTGMVQEIITSMEKDGKTEAAQKFKDAIEGKPAKATLMLDEDGNVIDLNAVVADNPDEDDHPHDVIRIHRSGKVQIY